MQGLPDGSVIVDQDDLPTRQGARLLGGSLSPIRSFGEMGPRSHSRCLPEGPGVQLSYDRPPRRPCHSSIRRLNPTGNAHPAAGGSLRERVRPRTGLVPPGRGRLLLPRGSPRLRPPIPARHHFGHLASQRDSDRRPAPHAPRGVGGPASSPSCPRTSSSRPRPGSPSRSSRPCSSPIAWRPCWRRAPCTCGATPPFASTPFTG